MIGNTLSPWVAYPLRLGGKPQDDVDKIVSEIVDNHQVLPGSIGVGLATR
ncbi:hypothetical protein Acsp02_58670 [Actinoplanes sp. NBRC 103695]|nr:hypothetical protein Acsp02_58670 [Actinoplanes sp. NBRC 103695]